MDPDTQLPDRLQFFQQRKTAQVQSAPGQAPRDHKLRHSLNFLLLSGQLQERHQLSNNHRSQVKKQKHKTHQGAPQPKAQDPRKPLHPRRQASVLERALLVPHHIHLELERWQGQLLHKR